MEYRTRPPSPTGSRPSARDVVLVPDDGRAGERGTHEALLDHEGPDAERR